MNKLKINIHCDDQYHLLAYSSQYAEWLRSYDAKVDIRIYDSQTQCYTTVPDSHHRHQNQNECRPDTFDLKWLASAEVTICLNDPKSSDKKVILVKNGPELTRDNGNVTISYQDSDSGYKNFCPEDYIKLTVFIKTRHETITAKKKLRKEIATLKKQYSPGDLLEKSGNARVKLAMYQEFIKAKTIFCYWSMLDEVDTHKLINDWYPRKKFILPAIVDNELVLREYKGREEMHPDPVYGILEPAGPDFTAYQDIDLALIPGIAFDENLNRLGRGKGFYDRIISLLPESIPLWGLAFDFQKAATIPTEEHDRKMNKVVYS